MDVIIVEPQRLYCQNGPDHGRHHGWTVDLSSQDGLDYGRHHGWAMDDVSRVDQTMGVTMVGPRMPCSQNGSDLGRHHDGGMDALFIKRIRPWTTS